MARWHYLHYLICLLASYKFLTNCSGLSRLVFPMLTGVDGATRGFEGSISITVFLALCILSIDFMIYFFFKLVYGEKRRAKPRRLPSQYYDRGPRTTSRTNPSSLRLVCNRKILPESSEQHLDHA